MNPLVFWYDVEERDLPNTPPERRPTLPDCWQVVGQHPDEMARGEVEEVAAHKTAGEEIPASEPLHLGLIEAFPRCLLGADHQSSSAESRDFSGVSTITAGHQEPIRGADGVSTGVGITEETLQYQGQHAFAVGSDSVE